MTRGGTANSSFPLPIHIFDRSSFDARCVAPERQNMCASLASCYPTLGVVRGMAAPEISIQPANKLHSHLGAQFASWLASQIRSSVDPFQTIGRSTARISLCTLFMIYAGRPLKMTRGTCSTVSTVEVVLRNLRPKIEQPQLWFFD